MHEQALRSIFSNAPGDWYTLQPGRPPMNADGASTLRPSTFGSASTRPQVRPRYPFNPLWKPVRANPVLYTRIPKYR